MNKRNNPTKKNDEKAVERSDLVIVLDKYGGDWTPTAAITDPKEAIKLRNKLAKDAKAICRIARWYSSIDEINSDGKIPPKDLPEKVSVCFKESRVLGVSKDHRIMREIMAIKGGLRKDIKVYSTAQQVEEDKPSVDGSFMESEMSAKEYINKLDENGD